MGVLDSILGGSSSSSAPSQVWGQQAPYLQTLYGGAESALQSAQPSQYTGMGQQAAADYAGGGLQNQIGQSQNALNFAMNPYSGFQNPGFQGMMQGAMRPAIQNFQENIMPSIGRGATQSGGYGGSRQGIAEGIASRGLGDTLGDISSQMYSNTYNQGLNSMMQGLGMAPQIAQMGMMPSDIYGQIGQQQEAAPWQDLSRYQSLIGAPTTLSGGGSSSSSPGLGGLFGVNIGL